MGGFKNGHGLVVNLLLSKKHFHIDHLPNYFPLSNRPLLKSIQAQENAP